MIHKPGYSQYLHGVSAVIKKHWRTKTDRELSLMAGCSRYTVRHLRISMRLVRDEKNWKKMQARGIKLTFGKKK